jgi:hypothetical protein
MPASRRRHAPKHVATPLASGCEPKCLPLDERQANFSACHAKCASGPPEHGTQEQINGPPYTSSQRDRIELLYEGVMRPPQVCNHQVCDRCGGRFGMVTHRWWGSKFCKRTCKDAYLREVTLDRDTIRRWFGPRVSRAAQAVGEAALWVQSRRLTFQV